MGLVRDPATPGRRQSLARVELVHGRGRPALAALDRVAAHPADEDDDGDDRRDGEQQPRVVANGLGRDIGLDRQERPALRRAVLAAGDLDLAGRQRHGGDDRDRPRIVGQVVERVGVRAGGGHVAQVALEPEPRGACWQVLQLEVRERDVVRLLRGADDQGRDQRQQDQGHHRDRGQPAGAAVQCGVGPAGAGQGKIEWRHRAEMLPPLSRGRPARASAGRGWRSPGRRTFGSRATCASGSPWTRKTRRG